MNKQPLLIICVFFILGIFTQDYFVFQSYLVYFLLIISFLPLIIFLSKSFHFHQIRHLSLFILFFSLGIFAHFLHSEKPKLPELKSKENIVYKTTKKLNSNAKNRRYEISAWRGNEQFNSIISQPKSEKELDFKHYYKGEVYVNKVEQPFNDFQFDYAKYLSRKGIYFQCYLPNEVQSKIRNDLSLSEKIKQKRLETLQKIDATTLDKSTREFTKGIILADRTEMDKEVVQDFTKSGLVHILAISGSHMAIIFWLILIILNPIFPRKFRNYKIIVALILIWSFAIFIDYGSSVVRSCIMVTTYYLYVLLQRKPDLLHAMAVAAFPILVCDTNQLFDVGFQLSFIAVFGIFWFNHPILKYLPKPKNKFQNVMVNIVSISFAAQIATLPLVIFYFHQYSFISLVANLVVIPFSELMIIFSLLMTIVIALNINIEWLNDCYDFFIKWTLKVIHFFADFDSVFYKMIPMTLAEVLVGFVVIYFLRFAIIKFNFKNVSRVAFFLLLMIMLRFTLTYRANQIDEVLVHQHYKETIISIKNHEKVQFIMHENENMEKVENYIIEPYLTSSRTKNFEIKLVPTSVEKVKVQGKTIYLKNSL